MLFPLVLVVGKLESQLIVVFNQLKSFLVQASFGQIIVVNEQVSVQTINH